MADFTSHLYQTNASNADSGGGATTLTSSGGSYKGSVDWQISGVGRVAGNISGATVSNSDNLTLISLGSDDGQLKITLLQNPYQGGVAYGGCAAYQGFIYNLTLVAKS
jgi:hypothetical protein